MALRRRITIAFGTLLGFQMALAPWGHCAGPEARAPRLALRGIALAWDRSEGDPAIAWSLRPASFGSDGSMNPLREESASESDHAVRWSGEGLEMELLEEDGGWRLRFRADGAACEDEERSSLEIVLASRGHETIRPSDDDLAVELMLDTAGRAVRLGGAVAVDADGRSHSAKLQLLDRGGDRDGALVRLIVDATGAVAPIDVSLTLEPRLEAVKPRALDTDAMVPTSGGVAKDAQPSEAAGLLAPPANDACADAISIPASEFPALTAPVDIVDATIVGDPLACVTIDRTIWYTFVPPVTGSYLMTTCWSGGAIGTSLPDTVLAVYQAGGGCGALGSIVGCNDDDAQCSPSMPGRANVPSGKGSTLSVSLTAGNLYYVLVGRYAGVGATPITPGLTTVQVRIVRPLPPANDSCAGTLPALSLDRPVVGSTQFALNDTQLSTVFPTCYLLPGPPQPVGQLAASSASGRDVVYAFTAPSAGRYSFRVSGYASAQNPILYVSSSCPMGPPPLTIGNPPCVGAANRNTGQGTEEVIFLSLSAGQTVYVFVDDATAGNPGSLFRLEVNRTERESEQNGTVGTADPFTCPVTGSINPAGDVEFYQLGTPAAGQRVFAVSDGAAANDTDQQLRITTATDTLEFDDDNGFAPVGSLSPLVSGTVLTGAASYARINNFTASAIAEPYRFYRVIHPAIGAAAPESEPNDTPASAPSAGVNYFSGALAGPAPSTDVDVFRFAAVSGTLITLGLDGDPLRNGTPVDAALELLNGAGSTLAWANDTGSSGQTSSTVSGAGTLTATTPFSPAEAIVYRAAVTGTYYARVVAGTTSAMAFGAGDYLLSIGQNCFAGDTDGDGAPDPTDCAPANAGTWAAPGGPARNLRLAGAGPTAVTWEAPAEPGASAPLYDLLRSTSPQNFQAPAAICLASDQTATAASDSLLPPAVGSAYFYLVRIENSCGSSMGANSQGVLRTGRNCP